MRIHVLGSGGDLNDTHGHFRTAYGLAPGDWLLVRPDGYIGAIVSDAHTYALDRYLRTVGLGNESDKETFRSGA
jgi:hypothetical protein